MRYSFRTTPRRIVFISGIPEPGRMAEVREEEQQVVQRRGRGRVKQGDWQGWARGAVGHEADASG